MHQIAEFHAAKGIVAEVLDDGATIGVTVRFLELVFRERRESLEKKWAKFTGPYQIHNFFVGENGITRCAAACYQCQQHKYYDPNVPRPPTIRNSLTSNIRHDVM